MVVNSVLFFGLPVFWYRQNVDINSPQFRRAFPKIVLTVATVGLGLVFLAAFLTAIGYNQ